MFKKVFGTQDKKSFKVKDLNPIMNKYHSKGQHLNHKRPKTET